MLFRERQLMNSFKLGDWVHIPSLNTEPVQYRSDLCHLGLELWKPTVDEWVWSKGSYTQAFIFKWTSAHEQVGITNYTNYEPFIGQLPTHLKDQS